MIHIYKSFDTDVVTSALNDINNDLYTISNWAENNSLVLNANKTKYMILGTKRQIEKVLENNL